MKKIVGFCMIAFIILVNPILTLALTTAAISPSSVKLCNLNSNEKTFTALGIWNNKNETFVNVTAELIISSNNDNFIISTSIVSLGNINAFSFPEDNPSWIVQCNEAVAGNYTAYVQYEDAEGFIGTSLEKANSTIIVENPDITVPQILTHSPSGSVLTPYVTLEVNTNEDASCKYDSSKGIQYETMSSLFKITGGLSHKTTIQDLQDNYYSYYIKCEDLSGNKAQEDYKITFTVDTPPTAVIFLNKNSPLKAGTVEVTVTTSEDVEPTPSLYYSFNDGSKIHVPLTGEGKTWKGYLFLENSGGNKIGSFYFSAKDLTGNEGTVIKNGNVFLVDTIPPSPPTMLTAAQQKGNSIRLQWNKPEDDVDHFKVYRLTEDEPSFSLYDSTEADHFNDVSVVVGRTYYYAVSAVDEAGNEGELSSEVYVAMEGINFPEVSSSQLANLADNNTSFQVAYNKISAAEIDSFLGDIEKILDEMNIVREEFQSQDSREYNLLSPLEQLKENKVLLLKLAEELGSLRKNTDSADAQIIFEKINQDIEEIKGRTLKSVSFGKEKIITLSFQESLAAKMLNVFLAEKNFLKSEKEKEQYLEEVEKTNHALEFRTTVKELTLEYFDGREEKVLHVEKKVGGNKLLNNLIVLEHVPKNIVSSTDEMHLSKNAVIIDSDPLIKYQFDSLDSAEYSYIIGKDVDADKISGTATIVLPQFQEFTEDAGNNAITGLSIASLSSLTWSWYNMGIFVGIAVVVVLLFYYSVYLKKMDAEKNKPVPEERTLKLNFGKKLARLKIEKAKFGNPGKEYPLNFQYAKKEYENAGLKMLKDTVVLSLLEEAETAVNCMDYDSALKLHHLIISRKKFASLKKNNPETANKLKTLQTKIDILLKCQEAQECFKRKDYLNLPYILNGLVDLHDSLFDSLSKDDLKFIAQIEMVHQKYSRMLLQK